MITQIAVELHVCVFCCQVSENLTWAYVSIADLLILLPFNFRWEKWWVIEVLPHDTTTSTKPLGSQYHTSGWFTSLFWFGKPGAAPWPSDSPSVVQNHSGWSRDPYPGKVDHNISQKMIRWKVFRVCGLNGWWNRWTGGQFGGQATDESSFFQAISGLTVLLTRTGSGKRHRESVLTQQEHVVHVGARKVSGHHLRDCWEFRFCRVPNPPNLEPRVFHRAPKMYRRKNIMTDLDCPFAYHLG